MTTILKDSCYSVLRSFLVDFLAIVMVATVTTTITIIAIVINIILVATAKNFKIRAK